MKKNILLLNLMALLVFSQYLFASKGSLEEFSALVKKSQIGTDPFVKVENESKAFKSEFGKNTYLSSDDATRALSLFENYPTPSEATLKAYGMMENGFQESLPTVAEKREFLEARHKLRYGKVVPYLSMGTKLVGSTTVYFNDKQKNKLGEAILAQTKKTVEDPATLIDIMAHLVVINDAIKEKVLKTDAGTAKAFDDLRLEGKMLSSSLNDEVMKIHATDFDKIKDLSNEAVEGLAQINSREFKSVKDLRARINPLLKKVTVF